MQRENKLKKYSAKSILGKDIQANAPYMILIKYNKCSFTQNYHAQKYAYKNEHQCTKVKSFGFWHEFHTYIHCILENRINFVNSAIDHDCLVLLFFLMSICPSYWICLWLYFLGWRLQKRHFYRAWYQRYIAVFKR